MTSEDDRRESSEKSSGERSDPRDSENRPEGDSREKRAGGAERRHASSEDERSESSEKASGEEQRDDPRGQGSDHDPERSEDPQTDGGTADEIPLNIAGHDDEKKRRQTNGVSVDTNGESVDTNGESVDTNGESVDTNGESVDTNGTGESDGDDEVLSEFDVSEPDTDDDEVEPVELLVQLADEGEIDPWDIDVVQVTDKFLDRLDEADLRTGGRALFYASVLLRMKSDAMWVDDEEEDEWEGEPWEEGAPPEEGGPIVDPFDKLESEIDRRIDRKRARGMPETLDELVRDLREHERDTWWKESRTYDTSESPSGFSRGTQTLDYHSGDDFRMDDEPTADEVTGRTHDEHMEDIINDIYLQLQNHYDQGRDEVLFVEIEEAGGSTVNTFLGLLFLAHRGQVKLQQDDLFGDLWIQDPATVTAEKPATADD